MRCKALSGGGGLGIRANLREERHSGRDCRNPEAMDGKAYKHIHVFWISAIPAEMTACSTFAT